MSAETPQWSGDDRARRRRAKQAAWSAGAGAALAALAGIGSALDVLNPQQAFALGTPAAVLLVGGLVVLAVPEPAAAWRRGARVGLIVGSVLARLRRRRGQRGDGAEPNGSTLPDNNALA